MKTKEDITYRTTFGGPFIIPKGTPVISATNLPPSEDGLPRYWAGPWPQMPPEAKSYQHNYGLLILHNEVEDSGGDNELHNPPPRRSGRRSTATTKLFTTQGEGGESQGVDPLEQPGVT